MKYHYQHAPIALDEIAEIAIIELSQLVRSTWEFKQMTNPKYENISQMESAAAGAGGITANLRLWALGYRNAWLRVVWYSTGCRYFHDVGRANIDITRDEAQTLIDREWGKIP